jgi:enoyl-CoA hydratase/carnithine racemase
MPKRTHFADYKDAYANFDLDLNDEGILLVRQHTDGGSLIWNAVAHDRMADVFADIAGDREVKVMILTGAGENFNADWAFLPVGSVKDGEQVALPQDWAPPVEFMGELAWFGVNLLMNLLEIEVPVIAAVNGPVNMHTEVPLMSDIVLCSDTAWFQDGPHYRRGVVPGDGQHIIWEQILGPVRARYLLLTGQTISAQQALEWGVVNEVLAQDKLLDRAYELARHIALRPPFTNRYSRRLFTQNLKRACTDELSHGIGLELYAQRAFYPKGGGMNEMVRPWTDPKPFDD